MPELPVLQAMAGWLAGSLLCAGERRRLSARCAGLRYMDLDTFAKEAKAAGAVVFMAVQGGLGQSGALQAYFEFHKVPFTGALQPVASPRVLGLTVLDFRS